MSKDVLNLDFEYTATQLSADLEILKSWLTEQSHLPPSRLTESDAFLRNFLVGCKGSLEKCKQKLDSYYSFRNSGCCFYGNYNLSSSDLQEFRKMMIIGHLEPTNENAANDISYIFVKTFKDLTHDKFVQAYQLSLLGLELELRKEELNQMKITFVIDYKEARVDEYLRINPVMLRDLFYILQKVMPFRVQKIVYVNVQPALALSANYLVKPLLSKKFNERLIILSTDWQTAADVIPENIMPAEYGGSGRSLQSQADKLNKKIDDQRSWFTKELCEKTDESKRPKQSVKSQDDPYLGMAGSFKALRID